MLFPKQRRDSGWGKQLLKQSECSTPSKVCATAVVEVTELHYNTKLQIVLALLAYNNSKRVIELLKQLLHDNNELDKCGPHKSTWRVRDLAQFLPIATVKLVPFAHCTNTGAISGQRVWERKAVCALNTSWR